MTFEQLQAIRRFCASQEDWLAGTVASLARIESPSDDKAAVDRCGAELAQRLEAIGGRVSRLPQRNRGDHLRAEFPATGEPENRRAPDPQVLLLGHFDTVWPVGTLDRMPVRQADGRLHGPGVFDMKAGIAIAMLATRAILETTTPIAHRIVMLWTTDEEVGSDTSRAAIEAEARRSDAVLVLEPSLPGGALKTARKGCGEYEVRVRGIAAHAGVDPSKGASAIHELAHQILRLQQLQDPDEGISINVGQVSGGTRTNVVAEEARAVVDVRASTASGAARVDSALRALKSVDSRTLLHVTGGIDRPPLERSDGVVRLYRTACAVAADLGFRLAEGSTGGGSDGNLTAALGVPTLDGLGAIGDGAHALHEHVEIEALTDRATLVAGLIARVE